MTIGIGRQVKQYVVDICLGGRLAGRPAPSGGIVRPFVAAGEDQVAAAVVVRVNEVECGGWIQGLAAQGQHRAAGSRRVGVHDPITSVGSRFASEQVPVDGEASIR